jgi:hypothetical protein
MDEAVSPSSPSGHTKTAWVVVVILIVVLAAAGVGYWYYQKMEMGREIAPGAHLTEVPQGQVVADFPQDLILEKDVPVTQSYRIDYADGNVKQPTASYVSRKSLQDNISAFRLYLTGNGWNLLQAGNSTENPTSIYAVKDTAQVNILLTSIDSGTTQVDLAYAVSQ